jgi:tetratricopeptide (TPR) repeat protein
MKKSTALTAAALSLVLATGVVGTGTFLGVAPAAAAEKQVSTKVGPPLKEAQSLIQQKNYKGALSKLSEAENVPGRKAYDNFMILQLKYAAYAGAHQWSDAAKTVDAILASGQSPADQKGTRLKQLMQAYGEMGNNAKVTETANRYLKEVGNDESIQMTLAQVYTQQKNYKAAEDIVRKAMAGKSVPSKTQLETLRYVYHAQGSLAAEQTALEQLIRYYPSDDYWSALLIAAEKNVRNNKEGSLDIGRIRFRLGLLKTADDFMGLTQDAIQQNYPDEGVAIMNAGMKAGVIGTGPQKDRHMRLLAMAQKNEAESAAGLAARDAAARKAPNGDDLVTVGLTYWSMGEADKAVEAIQAGIKKGVTDKDEAQLRLGMAYFAAGKRSQAVTTWNAIKTPKAYATQIAHLWSLYAANNAPVNAEPASSSKTTKSKKKK